MEQQACQINYYPIDRPFRLFAEDLTILLVLKGQVTVQHDTHARTLRSNDLYCLNGHQLATLSPVNSGDCVVLSLQIDSLFFAAQFPAFYTVHFHIPAENAAANGELLHTITELCLNEFNQTAEQKTYRLMKLEAIIYLLIQRYQTKRHHPIQISGYQQLPEILDYIDSHIQQGLKVKDIAETFYLSESALSKLFKKETGEQISHYIKKIQIHKSLPALTYSKKSIEQIALEAGFASVKVYREQFKKLIKMTPTAYRQSQLTSEEQATQTNNAGHQSATAKDMLHLLYQTVQNQPDVRPPLIDRRNRHVVIDEMMDKGPFHTGETIIQVRALTDLANVKVQNELVELIDQGLIDRLYCQHLLSTTDISTTLANLLQLNSFPAFEKLAPALAFLNKHQLPLMLAYTLPEPTKTQNPADTSFSVIQQFLTHLTRVTEPTWAQTLRLSIRIPDAPSRHLQQHYQQVKAQIRHLLPTVSIGVHLTIPDPATNYGSEQYLLAFAPLLDDDCDFISFDGDPNFVFQKTAAAYSPITSSHHYLQEKITGIKQRLHERGINRPLYLLNWNTLTGATVDYNGLFFRGAIILQEMLGLSAQLEGYGFWLNNELHEQHAVDQADPHVYSTGLDLYHFQSKKRPSYFCLTLMRRMRGHVIVKGEDYLLTKEGPIYQLLLWNTNYFDPHLSSEDAFLESQALDISLEVSLFPVGTYQIKQLDLDRHHGAVFYIYRRFQTAAHLDRETEAYIDQMNRMKLHVFDQKITDTFRHFSTIDTNGVQLLEFTAI
ncbi:AraC family transcriptional regulator [Enterococcus sp. RIT-PI-f]|uniref:AraC family transcriptional regulator n=1 Tax=Enterococcus sp. RIT-PI-f TaxID=1690244 RepID=UPI0006B8836A|nr:AraC family transcriptional regulator [Enterococcus sp. RIT-PI-f]KPG70080.1 hypothetical protein AEQ18_09255 [Enterococcus sp. RIT-PI-f]